VNEQAPVQEHADSKFSLGRMRVTLLRDLFLFLILDEPEPAGITFSVSPPGLYLRSESQSTRSSRFSFFFLGCSDPRFLEHLQQPRQLQPR
jgi:hypothetical protein